MSERPSSPEQTDQSSREQVLAAFRKLATKDGLDPADLDSNDPEVVAANKLHDAWVEQEENKAKAAGSSAARLLKNLDLTTIFVDAGFNDREYMEDVANDWLSQDLWDAREAGFAQVAAKIQAKIDEINAKLDH